MANQVGKRYVCPSCGSEMLVTRAGEGTLSCCDQPMQLRTGTPGAQAQPRPVQQEAAAEVARG